MQKPSFDLVAEIKKRSSISQELQEHMVLSQKGDKLIGLCPFHEEKTPSFYVHEEEGYFKCFGCGAGGDVIAFLQKKTAKPFKEVLFNLAQKLGLKEAFEKSSGMGKTAKLIGAASVLTDVNQYFTQKLLENPDTNKALQYLEKRGFKKETLQRYGVGFGGHIEKEFYKYLKEKKIGFKKALSHGFISGDRTRFFAPYSRRITLPIYDASGSLVGFGGRAFLKEDSKRPKYVNSKKSEHFEKGRILYGLNHSLERLKSGEPLVLVEGYFDVIALQSLGFPAVCPCGTQLSDSQISLLMRYTNEVVLCMDSDSAGEASSNKIRDSLLKKGVLVKKVNLSLKDPGEYIEKGKGKKLKEKVTSAEDVIHLEIESVKKSGLFGISSRIKAMSRLVETLKLLPNELLKAQYVKFAALALSENPKHLEKEVLLSPTQESSYTERKKSFTRFSNRTPVTLSHSLKERYLLKAVLSHPELAKNFKPPYLQAVSPELREILLGLQKTQAKKISLGELCIILGNFANPLILQLLLNSSEEESLSQPEAKKSVADFILNEALKNKKQKLIINQESLTKAELRGDFAAVKKALLAQQAYLREQRPKKDTPKKVEEPKKIRVPKPVKDEDNSDIWDDFEEDLGWT